MMAAVERARPAAEGSFPQDFLWGAATAAHQTEGNNVSSDMWLVERVKPTLYREPSGDACNSLELWSKDLDLVKELGLNTYRFSLEWARIEPERGSFSNAMLDHYRAVAEGCCERGIHPVVTLSHFSIPRWFAACGGWTHSDAPELFAAYCDRAARRLAGSLAFAVTLNEPNIIRIVNRLLPDEAVKLIAAMNAAAGKACGSTHFKAGLLPEPGDIETTESNMLAAHKASRAAIKAVRRDLPVGVSLSMSDDQAAGSNSIRDAMRSRFYGPWLELARTDEFLGVQNYTRSIWSNSGKVPPPQGSKVSQLGMEIYSPSLAGAVRYAHEATGVPILVTEHGVCTRDDAERMRFIRDSLIDLRRTIAKGVPVKGYIHWSLIDTFEWIFGYEQQYGLCAVDRGTFRRSPRPSALLLRDIARRNAV